MNGIQALRRGVQASSGSGRLLVAATLLFGVVIGTAAVVLAGKSGQNPLLSMAVVLPAGLLGVFLLVTRIDWLLGAVLLTRATLEPILLYIKGSSEGMGPGAAINALVIVIGLAFLLRNATSFARPHLMVWGLFLAIAISASRYAPNPSNATRMLLLYFTYFVMFAIPLQLVRSRQDAQKWVGLVLIASIVPTLLGIADAARGGIPLGDGDFEADAVSSIPEYQGFRIQGAFGHPNIYAFFLITVIVGVLYLIRSGYFERSRFMRWGIWVYLGTQIALLLCTQTRSAWAGLGVVLIAYGAFLDRRMLLGLVVMMALMVFLPVVQDRIVDALASNASRPSDEMNSYQWRLEMWRSALPWIQDRPVLGWGLDSYTDYSTIFFPLEYIVAFDAHSVYVQLAFETGLPGVAAFVLVFVAMLAVGVAAWRRHRVEAVLLIALTLSFLLACYSDNMHRYLVSNWYTFFVLGTLCAVAILPAAAGAGQQPVPATRRQP